MRPLRVPVQRRAIHQRGELAAPATEGVAHGRHAQHDVQVVPDAVNEGSVHLVACLRQPVLLNVGPNLVDYAVFLVRGEKPRDLAAVEDVVDVLEEGLLHDLCIGKEERRVLALSTCHEQHLLQVVAPLVLAIALRYLDLEQGILLEEGCESRQRLAPGAADAEQQGVTQRQTDDTADTADVLNGVEEHHELHRRVRVRVVVLERLVDDLLQHVEVGDALVHLGVRTGHEVVAIHEARFRRHLLPREACRLLQLLARHVLEP
mmetsp:Transcript_18335/g.62324  ORF Transcript_18335/g.62324 Transcript_18335/m.62324 type:complete len:262 (+) Transcript_18335:4612-5397(+)